MPPPLCSSSGSRETTSEPTTLAARAPQAAVGAQQAGRRIDQAGPDERKAAVADGAVADLLQQALLGMHAHDRLADRADERADAVQARDALLLVEEVGDVVLHADVVRDDAVVLRRHRRQVQVVVEQRAVLAVVAQHHVAGLARGDGAAHLADARLFAVVALQEVAVPARRLLDAVAGDPLEGRVDVLDYAEPVRPQVGDDDRVLAGLEGLVEQAQPPLGGASLGDVAADRMDAVDAVAEAAQLHPTLPAVPAYVGHLDVDGLAARRCSVSIAACSRSRSPGCTGAIGSSADSASGG